MEATTANEGEKKLKYEIIVEGLKLPTLNEVLRWPYFKRALEVKRVRGLVQDAALYRHGLSGITPLKKAHVIITASGEYGRRDSDNTYFKDAQDAIVARKMKAYGRDVGRRWGCVEDDSRKVVGEVETHVVVAEKNELRIQIYEV